MTRQQKVTIIMRAGNHELRLRILEILGAADEKWSPVMLHRKLEEELGAGEAPLGVVSYHVRVLDDLGLLKAAGRRPRRGAVEHYYRLNALGREALNALSVIA